MKKIRLIALAVAMLMMAAAFTACNGGGGDADKVVVTCNVSISTTEGPIAIRDVTVEGTAENPPTVLDAAILVLDIMKQEDSETKVAYELEMNDKDEPVRFTSITDLDGNSYKFGALGGEDNLFGVWEFTVDGVEAEAGMAATAVTEGQKVVIEYHTYTEEELAASSGK